MSKGEKFKKPQFKKHYTPEDAYNEMFNPEDFIWAKAEKDVYTVDGRNIIFSGNHVMFEYVADRNSYIHHSNGGPFLSFEDGKEYKPHHLLLDIKFNGDHASARNYILHKYLESDIPYVRVGTKYFKLVTQYTRYGTSYEDVILWAKEAITDDFGRDFLKRILKFDAFITKPSNTDHQRIYRMYFNMYKPFPHKPEMQRKSVSDFPAIHGLMKHIFGHQLKLGYEYFKVLYERPEQKLPVLCLVSEERQTGKTTLLNFMQMLFGPNFGMVNSEVLTSSFNSAYAHLNIVGIDETVIEKASAVEKIKMLATADTLMVNMKNVQEYPIEFFGKIVLATNKETDFMRIDNDEIRFWVRKPGVLNDIDPKLHEKLVTEIPAFLSYLKRMQMTERKETRMVFTAEEISNAHLAAVKLESRSGLHKDLEMYIKELFLKRGCDEVKMATIDIKNMFFEKDSRIGINYIRKVVEKEMGYERAEKLMRYTPYRTGETRPGLPYTFYRRDFITAHEDEKDGDVSVNDIYGMDFVNEKF